MYNFIVTATAECWDTSPATFLRSRIFEYTSNDIKARFAKLGKTEIDEMAKLPCLFTYEEPVGKYAQIGRITEFRERSREVRIKFELDKFLPKIGVDELKKLEWELDIGDWEFSRTHWALKDVDLLQVLLDASVITEQSREKSYFKDYHIVEDNTNTIVRPRVFRILKNEVEADLVSVMRPFDSSFNSVQTTLKKACNSLKLNCNDANEIWEESEILQDVFSLIYRSKVVICDFSNRNPNVFYEAGIAHTLGREVIPIVQNPEHIPFDLSHHRHIRYLNNSEGLKELEIEVVKRLKTLFYR